MTLTLNLRDAELDLLLLMIMLKSSLFFRPPNLERTIRGIYMYQLYIGSILNYHTRQIYAGEIPVVSINAKVGDTRRPTCPISSGPHMRANIFSSLQYKPRLPFYSWANQRIRFLTAERPRPYSVYVYMNGVIHYCSGG